MIGHVERHLRLWRVRRRHTHIDAVLEREAGRWAVAFLRNDRPLVTLEFADERAARSHARARLRELQIAGWTEHW